jgi:hypothetical protein
VTDFPEEDTFQDYRGKEVKFKYHLIDAGNIYSVRAREVTRSKYPRVFCAYDARDPLNALWKLRRRIPEELNKRYFAEEKGRGFSSLNFDYFRGIITCDSEAHEACLVVDGKKMAMYDLEQVLASHEGWHVEIRITEEVA